MALRIFQTIDKISSFCQYAFKNIVTPQDLFAQRRNQDKSPLSYFLPRNGVTAGQVWPLQLYEVKELNVFDLRSSALNENEDIDALIAGGTEEMGYFYVECNPSVKKTICTTKVLFITSIRRPQGLDVRLVSKGSAWWFFYSTAPLVLTHVRLEHSPARIKVLLNSKLNPWAACEHHSRDLQKGSCDSQSRCTKAIDWRGLWFGKDTNNCCRLLICVRVKSQNSQKKFVQVIPAVKWITD